MSAAHTPGPWMCVDSNSARTFNQISICPVRPAIKGMQTPLAKVLRFDLSEYGGGDGQANARLIAAAPDLLSALQTLLRVEEGLDLHETYAQASDKARAAINKATGDAT